MTHNAYVAYFDDVEQRCPDEDKLITKFVESLGCNNKQPYNKYKHGVRDAHAKKPRCTSRRTHRRLGPRQPPPPGHVQDGGDVIALISSAFGEIRSDPIHFAR
jgi:hypothetical protein